MRLLLIDNFDSFVYNLAQAFGSLGAEVTVLRSDASLADLQATEPDAVVISPGPGTPEEAGVSLEAVTAFGDAVPLLGVCLGHQCIARAFGARVERAAAGPVHGKTSEVTHNGDGVFHDLPNPFTATRYHSLAVEAEPLPAELVVTAHAEDGTVMGLRHRSRPIEGVQFHPESILCETGPRLLENFLNRSLGSPRPS